MPLVSVKCTSCGGIIQLDSSKKSGFCLYCGNSVIFEEAIQKLIIDNMPKAKNYFLIANRAYEDQNYQEACLYYTKVLELEPANWKAIFYKGLAYALIENKPDKAIKGAVRALNLFSTENNPSKDELNKIKRKFALESAITIDKIRISMENKVLKKDLTKDEAIGYIKGVDLYLKYLEKCIDLSGFDLTKRPSDESLIEMMKLQVKYISKLCNGTKYIEKFYNSKTSTYMTKYADCNIPYSEKEQLLIKYDSLIKIILEHDNKYLPPKVNRRGATPSGFKTFLWIVFLPFMIVNSILNSKKLTQNSKLILTATVILIFTILYITIYSYALK